MRVSYRLSGYAYPPHCLATIALAVLFLPVAASGQSPVCPVVAEHPLTPAETAYSEAHYQRAEDLYGEALVQKPGDPALTAALVHAELHLGEVGQASSQVNKMLAAEPNSALGLTALAEVQLHQGQPWLAIETLDAAAKTDPCLARTHLIRSRILRLESMYASERVELDKAYTIDPHDPDIQHAWLGVVSPAHEIEGIAQGLETMKDLDADTRKKAEERMRLMMPLLTENTETCKGLPAVASAVLPLQISAPDPKHIDGYRLEVKFPQSTAKLQLDTASSGMYISRALAEQNGFEPQAGDLPGTVHVDSMQIGPLEFHDCIVGVSDAPFPNKGEGFIGTDMFAQYLITLDHPAAKLTLAPLPARAGVLPGDRTDAPELKGFTPVYHRKQYLLVPVTLNNKTRKLFVLDSGIRLSTMTPEVAHSVSNTKIGFTNPLKTTSGATIQIYRDSFAFEYANLSLNQGGVLEFDPATIDHNAGFEVAGMLGFDMLHSLVLHLDYRDGLVKFDSANPELFGGKGKMTASAAGANEGADACKPVNNSDRSVKNTMEASVPGLMDAAHLKQGKEFYVKVVHGWSDPECELLDGAFLYGHVISTSASKGGKLEISLAFERGDCVGHPNRPLALRLIGVIAPSEFKGMHSAMPTEVHGVQSISTAVAQLGDYDLNLNPGGPPHTVHPGVVLGIPGMQLQLVQGPGCSDRLTTSDSILRLGPGTEFLLARESAK